MANAFGRIIDGTDLSVDAAELRGFIHRDYLKHCLVWSHIAQYLRLKGRYKTARILDVGCGSDLPLARVLHTNRLLVEDYVGIDYNPASKFTDHKFGSMEVHTHGNCIFPRDLKLNKDGTYEIKKNGEKHVAPNFITNFEVLEHVESKHAVSMMKAFHKLASASPDGCEVFISTPCWNVKDTAKNHVNEMRQQALGATLEDVGFEVINNYGTFANIYDYKDELFKRYPGIEPFFNDIRKYHDSNVLANMFCSPFPELSRNSLFHLRPAKEGYVRKFPMLADIPTPWASSEDWQNLDTVGGQVPEEHRV